MIENSFTNPLRQGLRLTRLPQACTLIIFGATGDLTHRKLLPALFRLYANGLLPADFSVIGFARRPKTDAEFRREIETAIFKDAPAESSLRAAWERFSGNITYMQGDFSRLQAHKDLSQRLESHEREKGLQGNRLFYLATPPSQYEGIIRNLGSAQLAQQERGWTRIIIEKPYGQDLDSARELNRIVSEVFREEQVYRIDHYLGKETVQNILVFRFANSIFEPIWNRRYVEHVQITVAESIGLEGRGRFFEETGTLRDVVQNHILQILTLVAMEPPSAFDANAVRDEKVKVLKAIQPISQENVERDVIRGQYAGGSLYGEKKTGYLKEEGVNPNSGTETFVAMKILLHNWRWAGVPFYLRTGKRLPKKITEIAIFFKSAPLLIFGPEAVEEAKPNVLALSIQPDEGISLSFDSKIPGAASRIRPVTMDFRYGTSFGETPPEAYERLLLDAMIGDATLFTRADETEIAWQIITPILQCWEECKGSALPQYPVGTWGPKEAEELIKRDGLKWRKL
jgi:glucose-6-phosphate 1-dehydrogenase